ncbi:glucose-dependent insulinotropic receptor-like [Argopecten irradians]|uniref:glucose-dependent insulinotropic receptor-like n=1 Tax=Argopecten irradians TaxID=31199 RepID=UPI00371C502B
MANSCYIPSNDSDYTDYDPDIAPMWIRVEMGIVGVATVLVNIPAIIAVILTKIRNPETRNLHLSILGLTDLLVGLSLFPVLTTFIDPNSKISHTSCFLRIYSFTFIYVTSLGQVCVICIDRACLLVRPSWRYTSKYTRRYFKMLSSMLVFTFSSMSLIFFILGFPKGHKVACKLENVFCEKFLYFSAASGLVATFIECVIVVCCVIMITVLQRHKRKLLTHVGPTANAYTISERTTMNNRISREHERQTTRLSSESKSTLTIIFIIINLVIFVTPLNLGFLMQGFHLLETTSRTTRHVMLSLSSVNSLINPFIYCFRTPEIRVTIQNGISKLFKC